MILAIPGAGNWLETRELYINKLKDITNQLPFLEPTIRRLRVYYDEDTQEVCVCAQFKCVADMINLYLPENAGLPQIQVDESLFIH